MSNRYSQEGSCAAIILGLFVIVSCVLLTHPIAAIITFIVLTIIGFVVAAILKGRKAAREQELLYQYALIEEAQRRGILTNEIQRDSRYIPVRTKTEVWERDQGRCQECGSTSYIEFDHIIPLSLGGATSVNNLQILCRGCNLRKGARV